MDQARKSSVKRSHIKTDDEENSDQTERISERREATTSSMASPSDKKKTRFEDDNDDNEMEDEGEMYDEMEVDDDRGGPSYYGGGGGGGFEYGDSEFDMMSLMDDFSMMRRFGHGGGREDFYDMRRAGSHWKKSRDMMPKKKINIGPNLTLNETQWSNFYRLLRVDSAKDYQHLAGPYLNIDFRILMPTICYSNDCHLRIAFFLIPHSDKGSFERILINYQLEGQEMTQPNNNIIYSVLAQIPVSLIEQSKSNLVYAYYLELGSNNVQYERDLVEKHQLHTFSTILKPETVNEMRTTSRDKTVWREKIDGVIGFGDNASVTMTNNENAKALKRDFIENLLQPRFFDPQNADQLSDSKDDLKIIFAIRETLIDVDSSYRQFFEDHLNRALTASLQWFKRYALNRAFTENEQLQLIKMFFIASKFDLDNFKNKDLYSELFKLFQCNNPSLITSMAQYFTLNNKNLEIEAELLKYLKRGNKYAESVNALVIYYYSLKFNSLIELMDNQEMRKNSFASCHCKLPEATFELDKYIKQYSSLFVTEPLLGSAILYYFLADTDFNLKDCLGSIQQLPLKSFFMYIGLRLSDQHDQFYRVFRDHRIKADLHNLKKICLESQVESSSPPKLLETLEAILSLIQILANRFSSEWETICDFIDLYIVIHERLELFSLSKQLLSENLDDVSSKNLVRVVGEWIKNEFIESLLINNGIESRSVKSERDREDAIQSYLKGPAASRMKPHMDYPMRSFLRPETKQDLLRRVPHFGSTEEYKVYAYLTDLRPDSGNSCLKQLKEHLINTAYPARIKSRIGIDSLNEIVTFRKKFDFTKYGTQEQKYLRSLKECIVQTLKESVTPLLLEDLCDCLKENTVANQELLNEIINDLLTLKWTKSTITNVHDQLAFATEWPLFIPLHKLHCAADIMNHTQPLNNPQWLTKYNQVMNYFNDICDRLSSNNQERLKTIKLLDKNLDSTWELFKYMKLGSPQLPEDQYKRLISARMKEIKRFETYRRNIQDLLDILKKFKAHINFSELEIQCATLDRNGDIDATLKLNQICESAPIKNLYLDAYQPTIIFFKSVDATFMKTIELIIGLDRKNCVLFDEYFGQSAKKIAEKAEKDIIDLADHVTRAWQGAYDDLKSLCDIIESGEIKLYYLNELQKTFFKNDFGKFKPEIEYLCGYFKISSKKARIEQLILYDKFRSSHQAAEEIDKIRSKLKLESPFDELSDLLRIKSDEFKQWNLLKMDDNIKNVVSRLERINDPLKIDCLAAFANCLELVEWLREKAPSLTQLNVLVDLASMSSTYNETLPSLDRTVFAKTLKEAGTAYASLIYDLRKHTTFFEFMNMCETVCSHLESDKNIASKLMAVKDKVDFLDEITRMKGKVELDSLKQAKEINQFGIYRLGWLPGADIDDVVQLVVMTKDGRTEKRRYNRTQLDELHNILMLVAPRRQSEEEILGSKAIELFVRLYLDVSALGKIYSKLKTIGCTFFETFVAQIHCDKPYIDITHSDNRSKLTDSDTFACVNLLRSFLTRALNQWTQFIGELRDNFAALNYFDLKQIKFMMMVFKKMLIHNLKVDKDMDMIRDLLFNIYPKVTEKVLHSAFKTIKHEMKKTSRAADLEAFWSEFLNEQNTCVSGEITMKSLVILMKELQKNSIEKGHLVSKYREIPGYLTNIGKPNLIICEPHNQIRVALSLYALSKDQLAPSNDEILFCQSSTSAEEIENFLRLVLDAANNPSKTSRLLFSLMNVQELGYEAQTAIERYIHTEGRFLKSNTDSFALVLICTTAKPSLVASLLAKYRVQPILLEDDVLKEYVKQQLQATNNELDPDNSSVRVLTSQRSGNGKSKYVTNLIDNYNEPIDYAIIRIKSQAVDLDAEVEKLIRYRLDKNKTDAQMTIYHLDIAYEVFYNLDWYLFQLIFTSYIKQSTTGFVWRRDVKTDYYIIELTSPQIRIRAAETHSYVNRSIHATINYLPSIEFRLPSEYLYYLKNRQGVDENIADVMAQRVEKCHDNLFSQIYKEEKYQRVCFYLKLVYSFRNVNPKEDLNKRYDPNIDGMVVDEIECLSMLLDPAYTKLTDPNWLELRNYINFADTQLNKLEKVDMLNHVPGLRPLCLQLTLIMADDFGLASLNIVSNTNQQQAIENASNVEDLAAFIQLDRLQLREERRWEKLLRPYFVVNADGGTLSFIGTYIDRNYKEVMNPYTNRPLADSDRRIPSFKPLVLEILKQGLKLYDNFNDFIFDKQILILSSIFGVKSNHLLEESADKQDYKLTVDNSLKLLAIYLRFISNIPVVIMGETGCGKTRLIRFFADLFRFEFSNMGQTDGVEKDVDILVHVKVHGGMSAQELVDYVEKAEELAFKNYAFSQAYEPNRLGDMRITCVLFFDEANTTEHVGLIKEIMCDLTVNGRPIQTNYGLKIVAAVNPYRKHSEEMIRKLESAGLGFYTPTSETRERIGHIPMRQLVYRVQPLPTSLQPLVWDFGQLDALVECSYIKQLVDGLVPNPKERKSELTLIIDLLAESQAFMRERNDECSFVSIRDIERCLQVCKWFISKRHLIFERMDQNRTTPPAKLTELLRAFLLSLMVCYHSCLFEVESRRSYRRRIMDKSRIQADGDWLQDELSRCQTVFIDEIDIKKNKNIAYNLALLENAFMMIICVELRIPLFIVGKPGSSKSLAKSIVSSAMQGRNSKSTLFRELKEAYFINFQCSPLTTSEMILHTFEDAARFQKGWDSEKTVAVVNLDEIGLAEGSESMPLKTLHPLLDPGVEDHRKVAVIGISNWALDPAKMNRGLFVARGEPDITELIQTARGICSHDAASFACIEPYLDKIASAYLLICRQACEFKREFYGLRDYYALVKMLSYLCERDREFTWYKLEHAVKRNFGGLEIDVMRAFRDELGPVLDTTRPKRDGDPSCQPIHLIESALKGEYVESSNRYLLFITENSTAIDLIQSYLINMVGVEEHNLQLIFGSSFRSDQQYSEICRNISAIKNSMELGKTVILLNAYNLYESLYDALNQYYYEFAGQKFVDLGLGTHRIKCSVHESFRLIIIAEKAAVYDSKRFPIPLLNRLEKHFLNSSTMLNSAQLELVSKLDKWVSAFTKESMRTMHWLEPNDIFIGLNSDTTASLVLHLTRQNPTDFIADEVILEAKQHLLRCATPDCVLRTSFSGTFANDDRIFLWNEYFIEQRHLALDQLMAYHFGRAPEVVSLGSGRLLQITTNSKATLLSLNLNHLKQKLSLDLLDICLLSSFETQIQFVERLREYFAKSISVASRSLLIVQMEIAHRYDNDLLSCVRHLTVELRKELIANGELSTNAFIALLVMVPRENVRSVCGYQFGNWSCYHLDELETSENDMAGGCVELMSELKNKPISYILRRSQMAAVQESGVKLDLGLLLKGLAKPSCSLIIDSRLSRTIQRIDLVHKLCSSVNHPQFVDAMAARLEQLQSEKERAYMMSASSWLSKEVAKVDRINQYATLRRACASYIEDRLAPLFAFLLSQVDAYSNLDTLYNAYRTDCQWKVQLWLRILQDKSLLKLEYDDMRSKQDSNPKELSQFPCQSEWSDNNKQHASTIKKRLETTTQKESEIIRPELPFFWLLVNKISNLHDNQLQSVKNTTSSGSSISVEEYLSHTGKLFGESSLYRLLASVRADFNVTDFDKLLLHSYIRDFLIINCHVTTPQEVDVGAHLLRLELEKYSAHLGTMERSLPLVHYVYDRCRIKLDVYLKMCRFDPQLTSQRFDFDSVHLDACLFVINRFKSAFQLYSHSFSRLFELVQLLSQCLLNKIKDMQYDDEKLNAKLTAIRHQYRALYVLRYLLDIVEKLEFYIVKKKLTLKLNELFASKVMSAYLRFFDHNANFTSETTVCNIHEFIVETAYILKTDFKAEEELIQKIDDCLNILYVDIIDTLCLASPTEKPSNEAVEAILKVITDKKLTDSKGRTFEIKLEYRTIVVQCVFKNFRQDIVINHLKKWFTNESFIGKSEIFTSGNEVALMFINCVYDQQIEELGEMELNKVLERAYETSKNLVERKEQLKSIFKTTKRLGVTYEVDHLLLMAAFKLATSLLVRFAHSADSLSEVEGNETFDKFNANMKLVNNELLTLTKTMANYIVKEFVRKHGSSSLNFIMCTDELKWMTPESIVGDEYRHTDRFILNGDEYQKCKMAILESYKSKKYDSVTKLMQEAHETRPITPYVGMALYAKCTLLQVNTSQFKSGIGEIFEPMLKEVTDIQATKLNLLGVPNLDPDLDARLLKPMLFNKFTSYMHVCKDNWKYVDLSCLLVQIKFSIIYGKSQLLKPLSKLILNPISMIESYLPTMPQDNMYDLKVAMRQRHNDSNVRFYSCPNGHIYAIGDCGRAWVKSKCQCGEEIGGQSHKLVDTNRYVDEEIVDKTLRGYCISEPASRTSNLPNNNRLPNQPEQIVTTEDQRLLNAIGFHVERFLINACMYLSVGDSDENLDDVRRLMCHYEKDPKAFFWGHMEKELSIIGKFLNMTVDEVIMLIHLMSNHFINFDTVTKTSHFESKEHRCDWEHIFYQQYIHPFFENTAEELKRANDLILEETTQNKQEQESQSQVYFMAYELTNMSPSKVHHIYEQEGFWRYRPPVSFELMSIEFSKSSEQKIKHPLLKKFTDMFYQLQLLGNIVQIVRFVKVLIAQFSKSVFKPTAQEQSIREFFTRLPKDMSFNELQKSIECFQNVWAYAKDRLSNYITASISQDAVLKVPKDFSFSLETKASFFLPTKNGDGLVCYAILHYLSSIQNEMLEFYHKSLNVKSEGESDLSASSQPIENFDNPNNIILFDKNRDLMRIVLSNFRYDSKELRYIFRYDNIEYQLIDRYLRNRPRVDKSSLFEFEYSDEINDTSILVRLNKTCRQEMLPTVLSQIEIMAEFTQVSEISEALNALKILINYVLTTSAQRELSISDFLSNIYTQPEMARHAEAIFKSKIIHYGKLKHLKHILLILMLKRAILHTINNQDPFDALHSNFKQATSKLPEYMFEPSVANSIALLLFQIIYFVLLPLQGEDLQTYCNFKIRDTLDTIDDLNPLLLMDPSENHSIPAGFPDQGTDYNPELMTQKDTDVPMTSHDAEAPSDERLKLSSIYSIWKQLCSQVWKK